MAVLALPTLICGCIPKAIPPHAAATAASTKIEHLILVLQENHSFDNYFGSWCKGVPPAATADNPGPTPHMLCNQGRDCCDLAFTFEESWRARSMPSCVAKEMDDQLNASGNPAHSAEAEWKAMHREGGQFLMDRFPCQGSTAVSALPRSTPLDLYFKLASENAIADRYFQPIIGGSSSNDMFLARAGFVFEDNRAVPNNAKGSACMGYCVYGTQCVTDRPNAPVTKEGDTLFREYLDLTIGDLLDERGVAWAVYMEGYQSPDCAGKYPWSWDPSDVAFNYYPRHRDGPRMKDLIQFASDLANHPLPSVVLIRSLGYNSEHPSEGGPRGVSISDGQAFVGRILELLRASSYWETTLTLITWDEGGGFYDHVSPPLLFPDGSPLPKATVHHTSSTTTDGIRRPASPSEPECFRCLKAPESDGQEVYGTRVPLIAVGRFARKGAGGFISHVTMEHSSIVKFIEWNWLGKKTGQLGTRDVHVNNLGSLLTRDERVIGTPVPEGFSD